MKVDSVTVALYNIQFDDSEIQTGLNAPTIALNWLSNKMLSPARHILHGKTISCEMSREWGPRIPQFDNKVDRTPKGLERGIKTVLSLVFCPLTLFGFALKKVILYYSPDLTRIYESCREEKNYRVTAEEYDAKIMKMSCIVYSSDEES